MTDDPVGDAPPWRDQADPREPTHDGPPVDLAGLVTAIPAHLVEELEARGLVGAEATTQSLLLVTAAAGWIARMPQLARVCRDVVHFIHLLEAEAGYDLSHSEPRWRNTILVSVPEREDQIGALRLAESVVHEAMHLHLTIREQHQRLVVQSAGTMASPWRPEPRPVRGVLHGLYVFGSLSYFFQGLIDDGALGPAGRGHLSRRLSEIAEEVQSIDLPALCDRLTHDGVRLARRCRHAATDCVRRPDGVPAW